MKIVHIIPGTGDVFYCQNCMRDKELVMALRAKGHDVVLVPMYLPLFTEGEDMGAPHIPVFYGAVGVYLSQVMPGFRLIPKWLRRKLDSRRLLTWVARRAGTTQAHGLEDMTLSVLNGENGGQKAELDRLVSWLAEQAKPDVVHLSNALLIGLAGRIRRELDVPVICTLQDEDSWIDSMEPAASHRAWDVISKKARDVAAFLPVSHYYSRLMQAKLSGVEPGRFHVIPVGVSAGSYPEAQWNPDRPVIGYLSRMTESLGLGVLADAFIRLKKKRQFKSLRLKIMGGSTPEDKPFLDRLRRKLEDEGLTGDVEFCPVFDRNSRREFLQSLSVMSVPMPHPEAFGMFMLEALASGVPVVQPRLGASPEIVEATGGGICYETGDPDALVNAIEGLLVDEARWTRMSRGGRAAVRNLFDVTMTAERMIEVYEKYTT